jgi:chromosomal replication initiation ATPase DnaA
VRYLPTDPPQLPPEARAIVEACASEHGTHVAHVLGRSREGRAVRARFSAYLLLRRRLGWSYPMVGRALGRDHSTVHHGTMQAIRWLQSSEQYRELVTRIGLVLDGWLAHRQVDEQPQH